MESNARGDYAYRWKAALIFAVIFALYFFTRSAGLDEWDSVQFAMGVRQFDLWHHQPHPPGYPLYIFLGWIGSNIWGWNPAFSLQIASCLGGALFVTAWFLLIRLQFEEQFAWLIAGTLAVTPIVWMTSTKVLTDSMAAGLLSVQLFFALLYRRNGRTRDLVAASLIGAAAAGVRPQLIAVVAIILAVPLAQRRASAKIWLVGMGTLIAGCFFWLLPMWYLQAKLAPDLPAWLVYPKQILQQWRWRLDKPKVYIGAGDFSPQYLGLRFVFHFFGWFGVGLGFIKSVFALVAGSLLAVCGLVTYFYQFREEDREFWKVHWIWAVLHVLIIFCCLPPYQRYYRVIMPLLLVVVLRGLLQLPQRWRWVAIAMPILLLSISIPLAIESHREEAPPLKFVRYLQNHYSATEREHVLLILTECERPVEWYAPEFSIVARVDGLASVDPKRLAKASAIYTDDPALILIPGWRLVRVALFHRSLLISPKHRTIGVYKIEHSPGA
jgi:hypothetical protein